MTKEEALAPYIKMSDASTFYVYAEDAKKAMDEYAALYAKQQAAAYGEWYCSLGYLPKVKNKEDYKPRESYMKDHHQLYEEFLEQQNKQ